MNLTDYYRVVLLGIIICAVLITGLYNSTTQDKSVAPKSNFEVVDTYKECEVVRWYGNKLAEYKYFLYCDKND
jgi:hypothetical protein